MTHKKLIYVCSKLRGNIEQNIRFANIYSRYVYEQGHLPIAPHCIFTQFLNDANEAERIAGMDMGIQLMTYCQELWSFCSVISEGMRAEIDEAKRRKMTVRYFDENMEEF